MTVDSEQSRRTAAQIDPALEVGNAFKAAVAAVRRMRGQEMRKAEELSDAQFSLLLALRHREHMSSSELGQAAELTSSTVTEMLEGLESDGLVERTRSSQDRRVVLTSLTARGSALVEERMARVESQLRRALDGFSERELATAARVLERLREMFDAQVSSG